jgi:outer membrane protein OmpA-like peptidoglycan-associated protein/tetratricopeptide (TPR) repeat protein
MIMKNVFILCLFFFIPGIIFSQSLDKKYIESIEEANEYLLSEDYNEALPILSSLERSGYANANIEYKIGLCYLNSAREKSRAILYLEKATGNTVNQYKQEDVYERKAPAEAFLYLGDAYRVNNRLKEAVVTYKKYLALVNADSHEQMIAKKRIFEAQIAQHLEKRPNNVVFEKLGLGINQGIGNNNVCISGDGNSLVFNRKMKFYDAIFYCTRNEKGWSEPEEIVTQLGSDGEFHPTALSPDGKRMLLISYHRETGEDIYESTLKENGKWGKVKLLQQSVNSPYQDIDGVYAADGKYIYFSSNRSGGFGGYDLYKAPVDDNENIGPAENSGNMVNTEWDEKSPSFMDNGNILIFSSQRKPGLGGFDFFYTMKETNGKWGEVYNMGYPVSTVNDDVDLSTIHHAREGLLAKNDPESSADNDIFYLRFDTLSRFKLVTIQGEVSIKGADSLSYNGLKLFFVDEEINDTVGKIENPEGGKYSIDLYPGNFKLLMTKENAVASAEVTVPPDDNRPVYPVLSEFNSLPGIKQISAGLSVDTIFVPDILFAFNKATISSEDAQKLDHLISMLKRHKITHIDLLGFTDNKGSDEYNLKLSGLRAAKVFGFFTAKGLSGKRITVKGMGNTRAVAINSNTDGTDNPQGRSYNRRVEIVVQSSDPDVVIMKKDIVPREVKP